jgi:hypothetical protein
MQRAPYAVDHNKFYPSTIVSPAHPLSGTLSLISPTTTYDQLINREVEQHINMFQGEKISAAKDKRANPKDYSNPKRLGPFPSIERIKPSK